MQNLIECRQQRFLGEYQGELPGITLIFMGAIHGNEREGVAAIRAILTELESKRPVFRGHLLGLIGNPEAYRRNVRYIDSDLNRFWNPARDLCGIHTAAREHKDFSDINDILASLEEDDRSFHLIDLHSFSGEGEPFIISHSAENDQVMLRDLPKPVVYGLQELIIGDLTGHLVKQGHRAIVFEGGRRGRPETLSNMIAFLWTRLVELGCIEEESVPEMAGRDWQHLHTNRDFPRAIRADYRHSIRPEDQFRMIPGFENLDRIIKGQELAHDRNGTIRSPHDGFILMPLYQNQGSDGFFIGCEDEGR